MSAPPLRVLVVDDERPARMRLVQLLAARSDAVLIGEAAHGPDAVDAIRRLAPDLVLLDVAMPGLGGFDVVAEVGAETMPPVVFVTAFDEHAVRAFDVDAVDYLVKPVEDDRFHRALDRARARADHRRRALTRLAGAPDRAPTIRVRSTGRTDLVPLADVDWVEADGPTLRLHVGGVVHLHRGSLAALAAEHPDALVRIHRSVLVQRDRVRRLEPLGHGDQLVTLADGTRLRMSRRYRGSLGDA